MHIRDQYRRETDLEPYSEEPKNMLNREFNEDYVNWLEEQLKKLGEATAESSSHTLADVPSADEINQAAHDEMQKDWTDLRYERIYRDGFIDGANWVKNKLVRHFS